MKDSDGARTEDESLRCYSCGREILDGQWFARIRHGGGRIVFCRPWCVEVFLEAPDRQNAGWGAIQREDRSVLN